MTLKPWREADVAASTAEQDVAASGERDGFEGSVADGAAVEVWVGVSRRFRSLVREPKHLQPPRASCRLAPLHP
ncbi:hypothetical protein FCM35_KLT08008 [Carex littledalei]|uniref:Uncharacterized protein n=1 Tax=Carex littledalei TaxID=544730 RepID=A0A833QWP8_9POAL|nr:hypothetical protein FCM35_KLT08008 [Carex littledalei]